MTSDTLSIFIGILAWAVGCAVLWHHDTVKVNKSERRLRRDGML